MLDFIFYLVSQFFPVNEKLTRGNDSDLVIAFMAMVTTWWSPSEPDLMDISNENRQTAPKC